MTILTRLKRIILSPWLWKPLVFGITFIVLFYFEEDWRGARERETTRSEWEKKGETFDLDKLFPPPIPDDQNLATIPLFRQQRGATGSMEDTDLRAALKGGDRIKSVPFTNADIVSGAGMDLKNLMSDIASGTPSQSDPLLSLEARVPFLAEIRNSAQTMPQCQFPELEKGKPPFTRSVQLVVDQIAVSKLLMDHALLALDEHKSDLALADLKTILILASGTKKGPYFISGLVYITLGYYERFVVMQGLLLHAWNAEQLAEIDTLLKPVNYLSSYQLSLRGEAALNYSAMDYFKSDRSKVVLFAGLSSNLLGWTLLRDFGPDGWFDLLASQAADTDFNAVQIVDAKQNRIYPDKESALTARSTGTFPFYNLGFPIQQLEAPILENAQKFAFAQVSIDETRIACAVESFRLSHHTNPTSFDDLKAVMEDVPNDPFTGLPYHYQAKPDGTFLLYSVGWNQVDDGGKSSDLRPLNRDLTQGDWTWPLLPWGSLTRK